MTSKLFHNETLHWVLLLVIIFGGLGNNTLYVMKLFLFWVNKSLVIECYIKLKMGKKSLSFKSICAGRVAHCPLGILKQVVTLHSCTQWATMAIVVVGSEGCELVICYPLYKNINHTDDSQWIGDTTQNYEGKINKYNGKVRNFQEGCRN